LPRAKNEDKDEAKAEEKTLPIIASAFAPLPEKISLFF